ncbi:hypothetical protein DFJ58DRAFT_805403 [Suillus subalutaceus]|uniref:uncharacterized protein n=1 Tax=Suillus subalutaceus TaxID=48586 RepID=UPI001B86864D|nr:uncharacterized protein DFJ58DRAFT_805403 [Suillus subalutaceus]KAG1842860.1 hypothetical protein DFJ58DRAFT_805403 [Suillus subalutaceus]
MAPVPVLSWTMTVQTALLSSMPVIWRLLMNHPSQTTNPGWTKAGRCLSSDIFKTRGFRRSKSGLKPSRILSSPIIRSYKLRLGRGSYTPFRGLCRTVSTTLHANVNFDVFAKFHLTLLADLQQQKDQQLEETKYSGDLTLPSIDFVKCDKDLKRYTQDVNSVTDITKLLTTFALRTIATSLHILHDIPEGEDGDTFRKFLQFRRSSKMCPVKNNIFDVVFLPSPHPDHTSMIILVIPPWALNNTDFVSFVDTGAVTPGSLDGIPTAKPASASAVMWSLLWDTCSKQKCQYFAVTTYEFWAFGNFSSNMQTAYISDLFRAPVHPYDAQVQQDMLLSPAISETLLFWMAACVGAGNILWTPCDKITS